MKKTIFLSFGLSYTASIRPKFFGRLNQNLYVSIGVGDSSLLLSFRRQKYYKRIEKRKERAKKGKSRERVCACV